MVWRRRNSAGTVARFRERYLTAIDPGYVATLSPGSAQSLELQCGPFSPEQARRFAAAAGAADAIRLRRWDEGAKRPGAAIPGLGYFRPFVAASLHKGGE